MGLLTVTDEVLSDEIADFASTGRSVPQGGADRGLELAAQPGRQARAGDQVPAHRSQREVDHRARRALDRRAAGRACRRRVRSTGASRSGVVDVAQVAPRVLVGDVLDEVPARREASSRASAGFRDGEDRVARRLEDAVGRVQQPSRQRRESTTARRGSRGALAGQSPGTMSGERVPRTRAMA
jgi:hypothetical protein